MGSERAVLTDMWDLPSGTETASRAGAAGPRPHGVVSLMSSIRGGPRRLLCVASLPRQLKAARSVTIRPAPSSLITWKEADARVHRSMTTGATYVGPSCH